MTFDIVCTSGLSGLWWCVWAQILTEATRGGGKKKKTTLGATCCLVK